MTSGSDDPEPNTKKATDGGTHDDLAAFGAKLGKARQQEEERRVWKRDVNKPPQSALGLAFRVSVELVSALAVGGAIGYGLDYLLGTKPWLMIVFLFLGGGAGMSNVYRMARGMGQGLGYQSTGTALNDAEKGDTAPREGKDRSG